MIVRVHYTVEYEAAWGLCFNRHFETSDEYPDTIPLKEAVEKFKAVIISRHPEERVIRFNRVEVELKNI